MRPSLAVTLHVFEKHQQLHHRHAPSFIRHGLDTFRQHKLSAVHAAAQLSLSPNRLYAMATAYNAARARKPAPLWTPGASGGDHAAAWPQPVLDLLKKRLACLPPCPYSFAASEALAGTPSNWIAPKSAAGPWKTNSPMPSPPKKSGPPGAAGNALKSTSITTVSFSPTPQAKGKIERAHQYWQGRLPAYFASEKITEIAVANPQIDARRAQRNAQEIQRDLRQTPQRAWEQARQEKRSALRPAPRCPWWDYVWSVRTVVKIGSDGRVTIGTQRLRIEKPPQTKVILCLHPTGQHSVLAAAPDPKQKPVLLFTNRPK